MSKQNERLLLSFKAGLKTIPMTSHQAASEISNIIKEAEEQAVGKDEYSEAESVWEEETSKACLGGRNTQGPQARIGTI